MTCTAFWILAFDGQIGLGDDGLQDADMGRVAGVERFIGEQTARSRVGEH